jgi:tripartite-type tricarboxylate transporter receptor subunit TctC
MKQLMTGLALAAACGAASGAFAQAYPSKPVRMIVPWTAGSGTDLMARNLAQKMSEALGQQVIVDNRGGAGAIIGTEAAAKSPPDGYTIYIGGSVSMAISPALYSKVGYDPVKDFAPVSLVSQFYNALSVHPSIPAKNVKEFIALAKARPNELLMGSAGNGSTSHLAGELFKKMTNTKMTHIPYKSGGQLVVGVLSGESHLSFSPVSTGIQHAKAGKLRMLGVSAAKRLPSLPDMPAIAETVPGYDYSGWQGVLVPAGTPREPVARLHEAVLKAAGNAEFKDYLYKEGSELVGSNAQQFTEFLRREITRNAELVKSADIKPQ